MNMFSLLPKGHLIHQEHEGTDPCGDICKIICEDVAYSEFKSRLTVGLKELLEVAHLFRIVGRHAIVRSATYSRSPRRRAQLSLGMRFVLEVGPGTIPLKPEEGLSGAPGCYSFMNPGQPSWRRPAGDPGGLMLAGRQGSSRQDACGTIACAPW